MDDVLKRMRNVLQENAGEFFSADKIMNEFKTDPIKNYALDDDFVEGLLEFQEDTADAFYVLHLIYSHLDFQSKTCTKTIYILLNSLPTRSSLMKIYLKKFKSLLSLRKIGTALLIFSCSMGIKTNPKTI